MSSRCRKKKGNQLMPTKVKVQYFGKLCVPADLVDRIKKSTNSFYLDVNENNLVVGGGSEICVFENPTSFGKYPSSLIEGRSKTRYLPIKQFVDKMGSGLVLRISSGMGSFNLRHHYPRQLGGQNK